MEGQTQERLCTGNEVLGNIETEFLDLSNLRPEYNVYKAVYALAHALHDLLQCVPGRGPFKGQSCTSLKGLEPWQVCFQFNIIVWPYFAVIYFLIKSNWTQFDCVQ